MSSTTKKNPTRSSLACLPCRSRHIKCDGNKPSCNRCVEAAKQCNYARSRRGGLDREALAERRKRLAAANSVSEQTPVSIQEGDYSINEDFFLNNSSSLLDAAHETFITPPLTPIVNIEDDVLIDSYYNNFHNFHPFLLPKKHMKRLYRDLNRHSSLAPLIAAMRFVGHIYSFQEWDMELKNHLETCFAEASPTTTNSVMVQSRLLYSIALFWYDHKTEAASQIEAATRLAVDLGMFRRGFATEHGNGDPILEECWRRTWWMLYVVEAFYAGTMGTMNFKAVSIEATVDLPCEELEYESGDIPMPKTLQGFDCREFATETTQFSSFAYLIGAVRCSVLAMSTMPKPPVEKDSLRIMQTADSALDGWLLLLPKNRKQIMNKNGEIDELMFQAHMVIHV